MGQPMMGYSCYVLDDCMQLLPIGAVGELHIGGVGMTRGYSLRPDLTVKTFVPNPFGPGLLYKSGDLARYTTYGMLLVVGRADFQVKLRGQRIELGEIETAVRDDPKVREAVAMVWGRLVRANRHAF